MLKATIARRLLSPKLALILSAALLAGLLVRASFTTADVAPADHTPCPSPSTTTPPGPVIGIAQTADEDHACGVVGNDGGSIQTKSPATQGNPHWTRVTIPPGQGAVFVDIKEIDETEDSEPLGVAEFSTPPLVCDPDREYTCLVTLIDTVPPATTKPMRFQFEYEEHMFPFEPTNDRIRSIHMYHNEVRVPRCEDGKLPAGQQSCVLRKLVIKSDNESIDEDVRFVILTTVNGSWRPR